VHGPKGEYVGTIVGNRLVYSSSQNSSVRGSFSTSDRPGASRSNGSGSSIWSDEPDIPEENFRHAVHGWFPIFTRRHIHQAAVVAANGIAQRHISIAFAVMLDLVNATERPQGPIFACGSSAVAWIAVVSWAGYGEFKADRDTWRPPVADIISPVNCEDARGSD
jgi:hypothetical protein